MVNTGGSSGNEVTPRRDHQARERSSCICRIASRYRYDDRLDYKYSEIDQRPLKPDSIRRLFTWKAMRINPKSIETGEHPFAETVIANFDRFYRLPLNTSEDADNFPYK
jgi:hypothetical protein